MAILDWGILGLYALIMIAVGEYYSRRNQRAEDYLLGGRRMNPFAVGLSLFSTLVSTLSYLSWPGEMIGHGPMLFMQFLSYPLIAVIVGWGLIPYIMRQEVTSAYELLEKRLGLGLRLTGAGMFLLLRVSWMAAILFATSRSVLVPLLQLSPEATPWICVTLGLITVVYSSAGGIKAVIVTDALQSLTMIAGGIITIAVVTYQLGGVPAWWPDHWSSHWDAPTLGFDLSARVPLSAVLLSSLTWYICTAGSDQMAIQRYLSTRDASTARKTLFTSLTCDIVVSALLGLTGLAVLGYFHAHPPELAPGKSLVDEADQLFPLYIMTGLPAGFAGLVIAGILSAAMSSLSSGVNSTSAVLASDFIARQQPGEISKALSVPLMRRLSWVIGAVAVVLSIVVAQVPGNLVELCSKVVNLLTAPLFVLFFMALFIPFATREGAILGVTASIATAVSIAFVESVGIGFLWITPLALLSGIVVAVSTSAVHTAVRGSSSPPA